MRMTIKRSELYKLVWVKPMTKVAAELGMSDVGLAKVCRRNGIPAPPRGHWAKVSVGKPSPKIPLPRRDEDFDIPLQVIDPHEKAQEVSRRREKEAEIEARAQQFLSSKETTVGKAARVHPMIKATRVFIERIPHIQRKYDRLPIGERWKENVVRPAFVDKGRRLIAAPNGLVLTVSDNSAKWATGMHEQLFRILAGAGCTFLLAKRGNDQQEVVACELKGERIYLSFSEGYRKHVLLADERAQRAKAGAYQPDWEWEPSGRFTWAVVGTEWQCKAQLVGGRAEIESKLPLFAASCLQLLEDLPRVRQERLDAEEKRQLEEAERARLQRLASARKEQVEIAFRLSELRARAKSTAEHLDELQAQLSDYTEPFRQRLEEWIQVVREELAQDLPYLRTLAEAVNGPYWRAGPPDWWPGSRAWPESPET